MSRLRLRTLVACDKTVVSTWGDIDLSTSPLLRARLSALAAPDCRCLILNLAHTHYMDGTGLSVLAEVHKILCAEGGELILVRCRPTVARLLHLSGFDHLLTGEEGTDSCRPVQTASSRMTALPLGND